MEMSHFMRDLKVYLSQMDDNWKHLMDDNSPPKRNRNSKSSPFPPPVAFGPEIQLIESTCPR